jgi:hypothetical protein
METKSSGRKEEHGKYAVLFIILHFFRILKVAKAKTLLSYVPRAYDVHGGSTSNNCRTKNRGGNQGTYLAQSFLHFT